MAKIHLYDFKGMDGVKGKLQGPLIRNVSTALKYLQNKKNHRIVSTAGDYGAVNVYIDDAGQYRAEFQQFHSTINAETFKTKAALKEWMLVWYPRTREYSQAA